jgi:hypothetical protein
MSSGEHDVMKKSTGDDTGDVGSSSTKLITPSPIRSDASGQIDPFVTDWAASTAPPIGGRRHKRPPPAPKRKQALSSIDQVMTQIDLPSYHGPHSLLDLVAIEIIFGRIFEAFQRISQATCTGTSASNDIPPRKKMR